LIRIEITMKTAAIEGQILQRDSVQSSVAKRLGLPAAACHRPGDNSVLKTVRKSRSKRTQIGYRSIVVKGCQNAGDQHQGNFE